MIDHKAIREALAAVPMPHDWAVCQEPPNSYWFKGTTIGASDPADARRIADTCVLSPDAERFAAYIAACNPSAIRALLSDLDAMRVALKSVQAAIYMDDAGQLRLTRSFDESTIDAALKGANHE